MRHESELQSATDTALGDLTRAGDTDAFAELWRRHVVVGQFVARQFATIADPDDIVSEAYTRVLRVMQSGGGPREGFRSYLYSTIRNVALDWRQRAPSVSLDNVAELVDEESDPEHLVLERSLTTRAFRTLPQRWQTVLWYMDVEGMVPAEVGPLMGLTPNSTSVLASRRREGFKQAWLQAHVNDGAVPDGCRWTTERMGRYAKGTLTPRARARFNGHLKTCDRCTELLAEIGELQGRLAVLLLPLGLGGAVGAGLLSPTPDARADAAPTTNVASMRGRIGRVALVSGLVAAAALGLGAVASAQPWQWVPTPPPVVVAEDEPTEPPATPSASPSKPRTPTPTPSPTPTPIPTAPPAPAPPVVVVPPTPADTVALAPVLDALPTVPELYLPDIAGTAEPGATVTLRDELGAVLGTVTAGPDGRWSFPLPDPGRDGSAVSAMQTDVAGNTSPWTPDSTPLDFDRPQIPSPTPGSTVPSTSGSTIVSIELAGHEGMTVQVYVDGVSTGNIHTLEAGPIVRVTEPLADGAHTVGVRYFDPVTGRAGAVHTVGFAVVP
ncbi:hypothetical protein BH10ACT7_BH10ACT7_17050 [soil metagenome]